MYKEKFEAYKPKMTESERWDKYFAGERVDHLPFMFEQFNRPFWNIMGYTTKEVVEDLDLYSELMKIKFDKFDLNGLSTGYDLQSFARVMGSKLERPDNGPDRIVKHILAEDLLGFEKLEVPTRKNNQTLRSMFEEAEILMDRFPDQSISPICMGPFSLASEIRPVEKMLRDIRKSPEEFGKLLDFCIECGLSFVEEFTSVFGGARCYVADPVSSYDLLNIDLYKEFSFPRQEKLIDGIYEITGEKPLLHICGHTKAFWPYLVDLNISAFSVDNCEDLAETKEAFGDRVAIVGNVPPTTVMRLGNPEDVIESVKTCIKKAADSPKGYIVNLGCDMPIGTPEENIYAYIYAVRKYGANAKIGEIPEAVYQD